MKKSFLLFFGFIVSLLLQSSAGYGQKIGLVLSGGGASGLTHVGTLKALEENNIPIDYISGTSIGAFIGSLYAAGLSPDEIEKLVMSDAFRDAANGFIEERYVYYFKQKEPDASLITFKFSPDTLLETSLPTNLISPLAIDFKLMELLSMASSRAKENFDSLFVPYRCVASDITDKKAVIFNSGNLAQAVRASMAYPFYLKPVNLNGHLLFDGGLFNNFPIDVMHKEFKPDFIIGSNVSSVVAPPKEDNIISQVKSMLISRPNGDKTYPNSIVIEPMADDVGLFEFEDPQQVIKIGYDATMALMDSIKAQVEVRVKKEEVEKRRNDFLNYRNKIIYDKIHITGLNKRQARYVNKLLRNKQTYVALEELKPQYFRLVADDKIRHIFPLTKFNPATGFYDLYLKVQKEKDIITSFGGNFSSRPINHAFIGVQYNHLRTFATSIMANSYFGKLYSSAQLKLRLDFPTSLNFYLEPELTLNRWDYFRSYATFFEEVLPSYLVLTDRFVQLSAGFPAGNKGKLKAGYGGAQNTYDYYQVEKFSQIDTADRTDFNFFTPYVAYERNTLNKKQFANSGTYLNIRARYIEGNERYFPGSTSLVKDTSVTLHQWFEAKINYQNYYKRKGRLRLGYSLDLAYSTQEFFKNYFATLVSSPAFQPIPESKTLFLNKYRAGSYAAFGLQQVLALPKNFDLRIEGYIFQPYRAIMEDLPTKQPVYSAPLSRRYFIASSALVYHSPVGPVSLTFNFYDKKEMPYSFSFNFGYIIFNKRSNE